MAILSERIRNLIRAWFRKFLDHMLDGITITSTIITLLSGFALTFIDLPHYGFMIFFHYSANNRVGGMEVISQV
jgi:hypothetical protein